MRSYRNVVIKSENGGCLRQVSRSKISGAFYDGVQYYKDADQLMKMLKIHSSIVGPIMLMSPPSPFIARFA